MASLNGVEIKSLKTFRGHEGEPLAQGNVYIDGKKMGYWSQDAWGGSDNYWSDIATNLTDKIKERAVQFKRGVPETDKYYAIYDDPDMFINALLRITEEEKTWKKLNKQGFPYVLFESTAYSLTAYGYKSYEDAVENQSSFDSKSLTYICKGKEDFNLKCNEYTPATARLLV